MIEQFAGLEVNFAASSQFAGIVVYDPCSRFINADASGIHQIEDKLGMVHDFYGQVVLLAENLVADGARGNEYFGFRFQDALFVGIDQFFGSFEITRQHHRSAAACTAVFVDKAQSNE